MEFHDHFEEQEGNFIPGIYNYCNSWCDRCIYTDKCRTYAMVALKGIDSSIGAWGYLLGKLVSERETIKPMIRVLLWLKIEVERQFPNAKGFEWPPRSE